MKIYFFYFFLHAKIYLTIYNCVSNLDLVKVKIIYFLFMEIYISFILHAKIYVIIILAK
jgi:hypothetical protein